MKIPTWLGGRRESEPKWEWDTLNAERTEPILDETFGVELTKRGFSKAKQRLWVRPGPLEMRHVVMFSTSKGLALKVSSGISLEFVPHISGNAVKWHRTNISAIIDLWFADGDVRPDDVLYPDLDTMKGPEMLRRQASRLAPAYVAEAEKWWDKVREIPSLLDVFEAQKRLWDSSPYSFYSRGPHALAYPFVLARAGQADRGRAVLDNNTSDVYYAVVRLELIELFEAVVPQQV